MLLTISTTHAPATDLGYLLHKHPDRCQSFDLAFGKAHVFYPEAGEDRCTAALLLDVDPVGLVRNRRGPAGEGFHLRQYVNDRPFVASSLMSVAIARVFGSALSGRCEERNALVEQPIPLTAKLSVVPCRGGELVLRGLFESRGVHHLRGRGCTHTHLRQARQRGRAKRSGPESVGIAVAGQVVSRFRGHAPPGLFLSRDLPILRASPRRPDSHSLDVGPSLRMLNDRLTDWCVPRPVVC